jgi:N-methylhydantoinase A/oxoprolinase/acetone carboxylase beta subunit
VLRLGVDVGGTNTDAVMMDGQEVLAWCKSATTSDVSGGITAAIRAVLAQSRIPPSDVKSVMIGTTHFTNAIVERKHLLEVAVLRLGLPATTAVMPYTDWPGDLARSMGNHIYLLHGGYEYDGSLISRFLETEVAKAARDIRRKNLKAAAITCVFSHVNGDMERRAAEIIRNEVADIYVTESHEIGRLGFLERENAAILNASLAQQSRRVVASFGTALRQLEISAPLYISQNDGTLMSADRVERYPVLTFSSGPTNSMRGAAFLSGVQNGIVVDIGGTTSDVGVLSNGFPRESAVAVDIGGVRTNFRMPDILAIGLGGGSRVRVLADGRISVGPDSIGYRLTQDALVFGGEVLTASDIAVASGLADIGDRSRVAQLDAALVKRSLAEIRRKLEEAVDRMKTCATPVPVILVGGGSILMSETLNGASDLIVPDKSSVANAIGAAIAQVSGEVDRSFPYAEIGREAALDEARREAIAQAITAGADPASVRIADVEEVSMAYMPGGAVRVRVKAIGDLKLTEKKPDAVRVG